MLTIQVKTGKREPRIREIDANSYIVEVIARAEKGKANEAVIKALAGQLHLPPSHLRIVSGQTSKKKLIEVIRK